MAQPQLTGRVFTRLQEYNSLPTELKREVEALEQYLTAAQSEIFDTHRTLKLKSVYGVRTHALLEKIDAWLKTHGQGHATTGHGIGHGHDHGATTATTTTGHGHTHGQSATAKAADHVAAATHKITGHKTTGTATTTPAGTNPNIGNYQIAGSATPATAPVTPMTSGHAGRTTGSAPSPHAKQLLDALILKGFVSPHKEDKLEDATTQDPEFKDNALLEARATHVAWNATPKVGTSVWDLVDGAIFAGMVKRKAGMVEALKHGKDTYAVVNQRLKNLTLFKTDLSRKPIAQFNGSSLHAAFDTSNGDHGIKVWNESDTELLTAASQHESDSLMQALVTIGASSRDGHGRAPAATATEKVRDEVAKRVGGDQTHMSHHHDRTDVHQTGHVAPTSSEHGHRLPGQHHTQPTHDHHLPGQHHTQPMGTMHTQQQHGVGGLHGNQPGYATDKTQQSPLQQQLQHDLPTRGEHVKHEHGEPRGFTQTHEPTMTP